MINVSFGMVLLRQSNKCSTNKKIVKIELCFVTITCSCILTESETKAEDVQSDGKPKTYKVVMIRHGESEWNKENRFCGWYDAGLSSQGNFLK